MTQHNGRWAPRGPEQIKRLQQLLGFSKADDVLVLSRSNDPFFSGSETNWQMAGWFIEHWPGPGSHIRRVHYRLLASGQTRRDDGKPYVNDATCWARLGDASRHARLLGLVNPDEFRDARNDDVIIFDAIRPEREPPSWTPGTGAWSPPAVLGTAPASYSHPGAVDVVGYDYQLGDQPAFLEIWIEKSTMADVLLPICQRLGINLLSGTGYESITRNVELARRAARAGKPVRVFYISDFDLAGRNMPFAVARQLEFWPDYAEGADIKLTPIALTAEQIQLHRLPQAPDRPYVELDALEALVPGELARIVEEAVEPYRDQTLPRRLAQTQNEAVRHAREAWSEQADDLIERSRRLAVRANREAAATRAEVDKLRRALAEKMGCYEGWLDRVGEELAERKEEVEINLPERPVATLPEERDQDWLYDSNRDYLDQLDAYKRFRAQP